MTDEERKKWGTFEAYKANEDKEREEVDVDKYFQSCLNGEEGYHAVWLLHKLWSETLDDGGAHIIMATMLNHFDKEQEWALCVKRVIEGRKPGMRNYLRGDSEPIAGSCTCTCNCIKRERW